MTEAAEVKPVATLLDQMTERIGQKKAAIQELRMMQGLHFEEMNLKYAGIYDLLMGIFIEVAYFEENESGDKKKSEDIIKRFTFRFYAQERYIRKWLSVYAKRGVRGYNDVYGEPALHARMKAGIDIEQGKKKVILNEMELWINGFTIKRMSELKNDKFHKG